MRGKMLGRVKHFARCPVSGHGSRCSLNVEIREKPLGRAAEKRAWKREVDR